MSYDLSAVGQIIALFVELLDENKLLSSILLVIFLLWIKRFIVALVRKYSSHKGEDRRHQINLFRQLYNAAILVALMVVWSTEVQQFALSIAAFMVGIVLALREFIQCVVGFLYYLTSRPFRVGDWIQVSDNAVGVVREIDWYKISLLEVDPHTLEYTGKDLYLPNSRLVNNTIKNLNFLHRYALHSFEVIIEPDLNPFELVPQLLERARVHCEHFREVAERYKSLIERSMEVEFIHIEPQVAIETNKFAKVVVIIGLFCPTSEAAEIQQKITADFMALLFAQPRQLSDPRQQRLAFASVNS